MVHRSATMILVGLVAWPLAALPSQSAVAQAQLTELLELTDNPGLDDLERVVSSVKLLSNQSTSSSKREAPPVSASKNSKAVLNVGSTRIEAENGGPMKQSTLRRDGVKIDGEIRRSANTGKNFVHATGDGAYSCVEIGHMGAEPLCR